MRKQLLESQRLEVIARQGDEKLQTEIDSVAGRIPEIPPPSTSASISNLIDNSDYSWSDDAYRNPAITPATAGNPNNRAYNWFWSLRSTALLVANDAQSLKGPLHGAPDAAGIPKWNKINGWAELGDTSGATPWDIACQLPNNFVTPSMRFYIQMLVRLGSAAVLPGSVKFFWEFWDNTNTAPLPAVIKGTAFDLTAVTFGPVGATTRDYQLIVQTDYGDQVASNVETVVNAPASLTPTNGVALSWPRYPGFTQVSIYVTVGGNSSLVGIVGDGSGAFNDVGQPLRPVDSIPSVAGTEPRAYAQTRVFVPSLDWAEYDFAIGVPATYDFSKTTGKQWLRGGIIGNMGANNQLQIDRIGISTGFGLWNISANDRNAASLPSTTQTGSDQGPSSGAGGPPSSGDGGPRCAVLCTPYKIVDADNTNERYLDLKDVRKGMFVRGMNGQPNKVTQVRRGYAKITVDVRAANGMGRRCSLSDRWITSLDDIDGTPISDLNIGDIVLTVDGPSPIVRYCLLPGADVGILSTDGDHVMDACGAYQHNVKQVEG